MKLNLLVVSSTCLTAAIMSLSGASASAQLTINSTGTLSGTIQLPAINPNFNRSVTRVDTDSNGTYSRNMGSRSNPNYVPIYKSEYVQMRTRSDGSLHYYVDFKGIPVVSFDGIVSSPLLSGGELQPYKYQGRLAGTKFQGVVQDEFNLTRAYYTGIVTDPKTGNQYQGTFELNGQGPRYSDRNGGASPTVFDFKSDIPGSPSVTSLTMTNSPLTRLTIKIPATATLITPTPVSGGSTTPPAPIVGGGSTTPPAPVIGGGSIPTPAPVIGGGTSSVTTPQVSTSPIPTTNTSESDSLLSTTPNIEFSGSNGTVNQVVTNSANLTQVACSQDSINCDTKSSSPKQAIGPRSRVLLP
ncbi:MAG: hypothetical protein KME21_25665 [Desmonostoc vinosum HA7617-LM4]|jgi:hypothetical protein|nr:hypothetical protein [Desmonostoc vinosum HA7617-LM4]